MTYVTSEVAIFFFMTGIIPLSLQITAQEGVQTSDTQINPLDCVTAQFLVNTVDGIANSHQIKFCYNEYVRENKFGYHGTS